MSRIRSRLLRGVARLALATPCAKSWLLRFSACVLMSVMVFNDMDAAEARRGSIVCFDRDALTWSYARVYSPSCRLLCAQPNMACFLDMFWSAWVLQNSSEPRGYQRPVGAGYGESEGVDSDA
jgi:hypothetical protein